MNPSDKENGPSRQKPTPTDRPSRPVVRFDELSEGGCELVILHQGQEYVLRSTRNGKLLLNK